MATLATARSERLAADGQSVAAALTGGYQLAFWIAAALVAVAVVVALAVLRPAPTTGAERHVAAEETEPAYVTIG